MGMTTGVVTHNGQPAANVQIQFKLAGVVKGTATTNGTGNYAINLAAGVYSAVCITPDPDAPCLPASFTIPVGAKVQNLTY